MNPKPEQPAPIPARARSPSRAARLRWAIVIVLALALPIAAAAWLAADELTARERRQADSRIRASLGSAHAELQSVLVAARDDASSLARAPEVRLAVIRGEAVAVARLARTFPGLVVEAQGRLLTRPISGVAHLNGVPIRAGDGRVVGSIGIATPLDHGLLLRLHATVRVPLLFEHGGRVVAAVGTRRGGRLSLSGVRPQSIVVGGARFRGAAAPVPETGARLVALEPAAVMEEAEGRRTRVVVLAAVLLLLVLTVLVDALSAVVRRRRG